MDIFVYSFSTILSAIKWDEVLIHITWINLGNLILIEDSNKRPYVVELHLCKISLIDQCRERESRIVVACCGGEWGRRKWRVTAKGVEFHFGIKIDGDGCRTL